MTFSSVARLDRTKYHSQTIVSKPIELLNWSKKQLYEAFTHCHGLYCRSKSSTTQVQTKVDGENDNLKAATTLCSPSPIVPAEIG